MKLTRFERKILVAITLVAVGPLIGALLLGRIAVREAFEVGVNPEFHAQLRDGADAHAAHLIALREKAERTADAVAFHRRLSEALQAGDARAARAHLTAIVRRYDDVARIEVRDADGRVLASAERPGRLDEGRFQLLRRTRDPDEAPGGPSVVVTIAVPVQAVRDHRHAGEVEQVYGRLLESTGFFSFGFLGAYIVLLLSVIAVALAAGFILSRRVTRRVVDLAEATQRVGAGDLSVRVPTGADDEVGELTEAFNSMVRDMRESRQRIDYLQRISAWQEFARRLAHEIKNPLTPIQLAMQEVHDSYRGEDGAYRKKLDEARSIVLEEIATLRRLVSEFSEFAKLPEAHLEPADLRDFVHEVERSVPAIVGEAIEVVYEVQDRAMPVRIDAMMLKRCVDNLVRNAVQALEGEATEAPRIVISARVEGSAILEVRDNGPGVSRGDRNRVFDPYYTTKSEGTGLGLAIVKKVVLEHDGEIECREAVEGGAAFRIYLPLVRPAARRRSAE